MGGEGVCGGESNRGRHNNPPPSPSGCTDTDTPRSIFPDRPPPPTLMGTGDISEKQAALPLARSRAMMSFLPNPGEGSTFSPPPPPPSLPPVPATAGAGASRRGRGRGGCVQMGPPPPVQGVFSRGVRSPRAARRMQDPGDESCTRVPSAGAGGGGVGVKAVPWQRWSGSADGSSQGRESSGTRRVRTCGSSC